jgi:hypothetical protein
LTTSGLLERIMNLIINPQFESLCPPLSEERDAACDEAQEARAEADHEGRSGPHGATSQTCLMNCGRWPIGKPSCMLTGRGCGRNWSRCWWHRRLRR